MAPCFPTPICAYYGSYNYEYSAKHWLEKDSNTADYWQYDTVKSFIITASGSYLSMIGRKVYQAPDRLLEASRRYFDNTGTAISLEKFPFSYNASGELTNIYRQIDTTTAQAGSLTTFGHLSISYQGGLRYTDTTRWLGSDTQVNRYTWAAGLLSDVRTFTQSGPGVFNTFLRTQYTYDAQGRLAVSVQDNYYAPDMSWSTFAYDSYTYPNTSTLAPENIVHIIPASSTGSGSDFRLDSTHYSFNGTGLLTGYESFVGNEDGNAWEPQQRIVWSYDADDYLSDAWYYGPSGAGFSSMPDEHDRWYYEEQSSGIAQPGAHPDIRVYPNPAGDWLFVAGVDAGATAQVMDATGRPVMTATIAAGRLNVAGLRPGMYLLTVHGSRNASVAVFRKE